MQMRQRKVCGVVCVWCVGKPNLETTNIGTFLFHHLSPYHYNAVVPQSIVVLCVDGVTTIMWTVQWEDDTHLIPPGHLKVISVTSWASHTHLISLGNNPLNL